MVGTIRKLTSLLLIILGISLIAYPKAKEAYYDYQQRQLLAALEESWAALDDHAADEIETGPNEDSPPEPEGEDPHLREYITAHTEGILKIDKISLELPILQGASKKNLAISAGSIEGTGSPGQAGNYSISAHRARTYGRQFNRLDELKTGDTIEIIVKDVTYTYEVFDKLTVRAEDTWVMLPEGEEKLLTLITCDYRNKDFPRLIVKARLAEHPLEAWEDCH